jgi:hypothetical protein
MEAHADAARGRLESVTAMTVEETRSLHHAAKRREDGLEGDGKAEEPWAVLAIIFLAGKLWFNQPSPCPVHMLRLLISLSFADDGYRAASTWDWTNRWWQTPVAKSLATFALARY